MSLRDWSKTVLVPHSESNVSIFSKINLPSVERARFRGFRAKDTISGFEMPLGLQGLTGRDFDSIFSGNIVCRSKLEGKLVE